MSYIDRRNKEQGAEDKELAEILCKFCGRSEENDCVISEGGCVDLAEELDHIKELGYRKPGRLTEKIRTIARSMITASHYNQLDDTTFDNYLLEMFAQAQYDQRGE